MNINQIKEVLIIEGMANTKSFLVTLENDIILSVPEDEQNKDYIVVKEWLKTNKASSNKKKNKE